MRFEVQLFGALREAEPGAALVLESDAADIAALRADVARHAESAWPAAARALLGRSAFASERSILRDADPVPDDRRLALLPPVSGG